MNETIIIITTILNVAIFGLNIVISIKLKFAKRENQIINFAKTLIINTVLFLAVSGNIYLLYKGIKSPSPFDKDFVIHILNLSFSLAGLFFIYFMFSFLSILKDLLKMIELYNHKK